MLESTFEVVFYDSCALAEVDLSTYTEKALHHQFTNGGIDRAVHALDKLENGASHILAFSIGGTIAWKLALRRRTIQSLTCISSTRLRKETIRPQNLIQLYYGGLDPYKPDITWLAAMKLDYAICTYGDHGIYTDRTFAKKVCHKIIRTANDG